MAVALARITKAILDNENAILPLSVYLDDLYGQKDVYLGAPAVIGSEGIKNIIELKLDESEMNKLNLSSKTLKEAINKAFESIK